VLHALRRRLASFDRCLRKHTTHQKRNMISATRTFLSHSALHDQVFADPTKYGPSSNLTQKDGSRLTLALLASDVEYWKQAARPTFVPPHHARGEGQKAGALRARPVRTGTVPDRFYVIFQLLYGCHVAGSYHTHARPLIITRLHLTRIPGL
jgi:hypothetical protein